MSDEPDPAAASKAVAAILKRIQAGNTDWIHAMRIWTGHVQPKLTGVIDRFLEDAASNDAAAAVVLMMSAAYEAGRAYQVAENISRVGLSMPSAVPAQTRLPSEPQVIKLSAPATYDQADLQRFEGIGGKIDANGHRVYVVQATKQAERDVAADRDDKYSDWGGKH